MNRMEGKGDAGGLEADVLIDEARWEQVLPDVQATCLSAAGAAYRCAEQDGRGRSGAAFVCILLADDARLRDLNRTFRGRDEPTNVLAFPSVEPDVLAAIGADGLPDTLGDIVIAFETTAAEAARDDGASLSAHLSHLVVHGILHLLGYDHGTECDAIQMEALEARALASIGIADPYAPSDSAHE